MPVAIDTISQLDLFKDLNTAELTRIAAITQLLRVGEGETLTRRDDAANTFYIIISGMFMISYQKERALTLNRKGDFVGWSSVADPQRYTGATTALTAGEVLAIAGSDMLSLMDENPDLKDKVMARITAGSTPRKTLDAAE